ncbi:MAG: hypothetical protein ACYCTB_10520 [bacterium]
MRLIRLINLQTGKKNEIDACPYLDIFHPFNFSLILNTTQKKFTSDSSHL